ATTEAEIGCHIDGVAVVPQQVLSAFAWESAISIYVLHLSKSTPVWIASE
nr:hypothetical protein [Tanacetum cinerariifolium]